MLQPPQRKTVAFKEPEDDVGFLPPVSRGCGACQIREREKFEALTLARGTQRLLLRNQEAYFRLEETCREAQRRQRESTTQVLQQNSRLIAEKAELEKKLAQADSELAELRQMRDQLAWMKANWPTGPHHHRRLEVEELGRQRSEGATEPVRNTTPVKQLPLRSKKMIRVRRANANKDDNADHDNNNKENSEPPRTPTKSDGIQLDQVLLSWTPVREILADTSTPPPRQQTPSTIDLLSPFPDTPPPVVVVVSSVIDQSSSLLMTETSPPNDESYSCSTRPSRRATLNLCYREPSGKVKLRRGSAPGFKLV